MNAMIKPVDTSKYLKLLHDGSEVSAEDPRTDHLVLRDQELKLDFYVNSIGINGKRAKDVRDTLPIVAQLDVLGTGWRWPTLEEALTIVRRDRHNPAVDTNLLPGIKADWHVTSTPAAWAPARAAWWLFLNDGNVYDFSYLVLGGWALAVRPAGQ